MLQNIGRKPIFYGWFIVAAGFFSLFVSMGARNGFGVFINPMEADFEWGGRTALSIVIGIGTLMNAITQPFIGRLYDRFGGLTVISVSLLLLGLTTITMSLTSNLGLNFAIPISISVNLLFFELDQDLFTLTGSLLFLIVMYGIVMSTASGGVSLVTIHSLLSKWFYRKRGIVLSLATAGSSVGGLILTPFAAYLILGTHWRIAWLALGSFVLLLALPLALLIVRDSPEKVGQLPDGEANDLNPKSTNRSTAVPEAPLETKDWKDSFKSPPFWQLSGAYFVCGVTTIIISAHYVPFAMDLGISAGVASLAFGFMQGLNAVGVIVVGLLSDRFSRKNLLGIIYFIRFLAYVMLVTPGFMMMLWGTSIPPSIAVWGFATLAGLSWIATPPLTSSLTADIYGVRNIGTLNGLITMAHQIGGFLSVVLAGVLYDITGSYEIPFAIAGLFLLGATLASFSVNERKFSIRYQLRPAMASAAKSN